MVRIATPISSLFNDKENARRIISLSDCLECRDQSIKSELLNQELFHCELQPIHEFSKAKLKYLELIKRRKSDLKLLTFHVASSCNRPYIRNGMFEKAEKEYTEKQALRNAKNNFKEIKIIFGDKIGLAIENTNFYPTNAYKYITEAGFISRIIYENNIQFLFDLAHARITAHNNNIDYEKYMHSLPLDRIIQIHISSCGVRKDGLAFDAHDYPRKEEYIEVKRLIKDGFVRYLTVEYYKDTARLMRSLKLLKELI